MKSDTKAAIKYTLDKLSIPVADGAVINDDIKLTTKGYLGTTVAWTSSDPDIMSDTGRINGNGTVTLTMTLTKDNYIYKKAYQITVDKNAAEYVPTYYPESEQKRP